MRESLRKYGVAGKKAKARMNKPPKICRRCGKEYSGYSMRPKYCSETCLQKTAQQKHKARHRGVVKERRLQVIEYKARLKTGGCVFCGYNRFDPALEFHHISGKDIALSVCGSIAAIDREIDKFPIIVLCSNCHRELHGGMFDFIDTGNMSLRPVREVDSTQ